MPSGILCASHVALHSAWPQCSADPEVCMMAFMCISSGEPCRRQQGQSGEVVVELVVVKDGLPSF